MDNNNELNLGELDRIALELARSFHSKHIDNVRRSHHSANELLNYDFVINILSDSCEAFRVILSNDDSIEMKTKIEAIKLLINIYPLNDICDLALKLKKDKFWAWGEAIAVALAKIVLGVPVILKSATNQEINFDFSGLNFRNKDFERHINKLINESSIEVESINIEGITYGSRKANTINKKTIGNKRS